MYIDKQQEHGDTCQVTKFVVSKVCSLFIDKILKHLYSLGTTLSTDYVATFYNFVITAI